jgi:hypothetical protein
MLHTTTPHTVPCHNHNSNLTLTHLPSQAQDKAHSLRVINKEMTPDMSVFESGVQSLEYCRQVWEHVDMIKRSVHRFLSSSFKEVDVPEVLNKMQGWRHQVAAMLARQADNKRTVAKARYRAGDEEAAVEFDGTTAEDRGQQLDHAAAVARKFDDDGSCELDPQPRSRHRLGFSVCAFASVLHAMFYYCYFCCRLEAVATATLVAEVQNVNEADV